MWLKTLRWRNGKEHAGNWYYCSHLIKDKRREHKWKGNDLISFNLVVPWLRDQMIVINDKALNLELKQSEFRKIHLIYINNSSHVVLTRRQPYFMKRKSSQGIT